MTSASSDGVWTKDIEEAFEEALAIYPPCGRRKIILSDEGKMYGRNELIARYIKMRTGKHRSRKQVSSHIQVLSRKRAREAAGLDDDGHPMGMVDDATARAVEGLAGLSALASPAESDASTPSVANGQSPASPAGGQKRARKGTPTSTRANTDHAKAVTSGAYALIGLAHSPTASPRPTAPNPVIAAAAAAAAAAASGNGTKILPNPFAPPKMSLVDMVGFLEYRAGTATKRHSFVHLIGPAPFHDPHLETVDIKQIYDKFPGLKELYATGPKSAFFLIKFWADLSVEQTDGYYGMMSRYIADEDPVIKCSTKVCSFGKQVVEKIQVGPLRRVSVK
eukprot:Opistho-1_new@75919